MDNGNTLINVRCWRARDEYMHCFAEHGKDSEGFSLSD
jgi:hypothetical protein